MRDQGQDERHHQADRCQLNSGHCLQSVGGREASISQCLVKAEKGGDQCRRQKKRQALRQIVVPVISAVKDSQRLRDVEV